MGTMTEASSILQQDSGAATTRAEWTDAERAEATARVAAYFRSLGVRDALRITTAADDVINQVAQDHPTAHGRDLAAAAMDEARKAVRGWLIRLVEAGLLPEPTPRTSGLIVWRLRPALHRYPEAFLQHEGLPAGFIAAVQPPTPEILPQTLPGQMDSQPIEFRAVRLPRRFFHPIRALNDLTHDLVLSVVGGR